MISTAPGAISNSVGSAVPVCIPFDTVQSPGSYVCNWSGYLLRVPVGALGPPCGRTINIVGSEPLFVTKISDDPTIPVPRAREVASSLNLRVCF